MRVVLLLVILFCYVSTSIAEEVESSRKVTVGFLLTMSGNYAIAGSDIKKGIDAAVNQLPTVSIDSVYADSRNDPFVGMTEFNSLKNVHNVDVVLINRATIGIPLNSLSNSYKIPLVGIVGHDDFTVSNPYAFQTWPSSSVEGSFIAENLIKEGFKKVAVLTTIDEYLSSVSREFEIKIKEHGGTIVFSESITPDSVDIKSLILKMRKNLPEAVFVNVSIPQIPICIKQVREQVRDARIVSNIYVGKKEVLQLIDRSYSEGIQFIGIDSAAPSLKKNLNIEINESVPPLTFSAWISVHFLNQAALLKKEKGLSMFDAMNEITEVKTPDRVYQIRNRRLELPLVMRTIRKEANAE